MASTVATLFATHQAMDHEHYDWLPLNARRAPLLWPENARVALSASRICAYCQPVGSYPFSRRQRSTKLV